MDHIVTGALAVVRGADGHNQTFYQGAIVPDGFADTGHVKHLVAIGLLGKLPSTMPAPVLTVPIAPTDTDDPDGTESTGAKPPSGTAPVRPPRAAAKGVWVEYAISQGMDPHKAEAAGKDELVAAYPAPTT